jgi:hypothetical protein
MKITSTAETVVGCCESMSDAVKWHFLEILEGEVMLPRRTLTEVDPEATAGNVLSGETYDPAEFVLTLSLSLCPWCGVKLVAEEVRACRECGCTDDIACPGGCYWVEGDLCSECADHNDLVLG